MSNSPPWEATKGTLSALQDQFPERLGHCILYQSPWVFQTLYNLCSPLIDPVTFSKLVFVAGDVSEGSANDKMMKELLHDNWKEITGAEGEIHEPQGSPGYKHKTYWAKVVEQHS